MNRWYYIMVKLIIGQIVKVHNEAMTCPITGRLTQSMYMCVIHDSDKSVDLVLIIRIPASRLAAMRALKKDFTIVFKPQ